MVVYITYRCIVSFLLLLFTGLFNISDKVLITFTILLEFREHFNKGHPIGNAIEAKLAALKLKCKEVWYSFKLFIDLILFGI